MIRKVNSIGMVENGNGNYDLDWRIFGENN
jgi:hypothetical protein